VVPYVFLLYCIVLLNHVVLVILRMMGVEYLCRWMLLLASTRECSLPSSTRYWFLSEWTLASLCQLSYIVTTHKNQQWNVVDKKDLRSLHYIKEDAVVCSNKCRRSVSNHGDNDRVILLTDLVPRLSWSLRGTVRPACRLPLLVITDNCCTLV